MGGPIFNLTFGESCFIVELLMQHKFRCVNQGKNKSQKFDSIEKKSPSTMSNIFRIDIVTCALKKSKQTSLVYQIMKVPSNWTNSRQTEAHCL